jgi:hypothetical protein
MVNRKLSFHSCFFPVFIAAFSAMAQIPPAARYFARNLFTGLHLYALSVMGLAVIITGISIFAAWIYFGIKKRRYRQILDLRHQQAMMEIPVEPGARRVERVDTRTDEEVMREAEELLAKTSDRFGVTDQPPPAA